MRDTAIAMVVGFALAILTGTVLDGCVSTKSYRSVLQGVTDAQADIVSGLNEIDAVCQASQHDAAGLSACRGPRDRARAALRKQLDALNAAFK